MKITIVIPNTALGIVNIFEVPAYAKNNAISRFFENLLLVLEKTIINSTCMTTIISPDKTRGTNSCLTFERKTVKILYSQNTLISSQ